MYTHIGSELFAMSLLAERDHLDGRPSAYKNSSKIPPLTPFFEDKDHGYRRVRSFEFIDDLTLQTQPKNVHKDMLHSSQKNIPLKKRLLALLFSCIA